MKKKFFNYVIPSVVAMWVFSIYTMVDGIFVAQGVGPDALAAVNIAIPFVNVFFALSLLFATGTSTVTAILLGQNKKEKARSVFTQTVIILCVISFIIGVITFFNLDSLADFLGASPLTKDYVVNYLRIIIPFNGFFMIAYLMEVMVKTDGFPKLATFGVICSALTNVILDWIFVLIFGWGIEGAAAATAISQIAGVVFFMIHFLKKPGALYFQKFKWDFSVYKRILPIGFSDFITDFSLGSVIFFFNITILRVIGPEAQAAYSVIAYIGTIVVTSATGISQGMQPLVSFHYGRNEPEIYHRFLKMGFITAIVTSIGAYLIANIFTSQLVGIFINATTDPEIFTQSVAALKLYSFAFLGVGLNVVVAGYFAAIAKARKAIIISLSRGLVMIFIALLILPNLLGATGIWLASTASEVATLILAFGLFFKYYKDEKEWITKNKRIIAE